jgi:uncharacterized protein YigE (DUF2233 family)
MEPVTWSALEHDGASCAVVTVDLTRASVELVADHTISSVEARPGVLAATNAGLFHAADVPVGWTVVAGVELRPIERGEGAGNFFLQPNGAAWLDGAGLHVTRTARIAASGRVGWATQSGPMLVEGGQLHPAFKQDSDSRKVRNGVGRVDDHTLVLARCEPLNFWSFGTLFRDRLGAPDALFLDGTISTLFGPEHPPTLRARNEVYATFLVVTAR